MAEKKETGAKSLTPRDRSEDHEAFARCSPLRALDTSFKDGVRTMRQTKPKTIAVQ